MSHEIENKMIAYSGQVPWHGIGAELPEGSTTKAFLKAANLDWSLDKYPLEAIIGNVRVPVKDKYGLVRSSDNKVMTICGEKWTALQNANALNFMRRYCEAGGAVMETAGGLRDGQIVWALARLKHSFDVRPGDTVNGYLLITTSHIVGTTNKVQTTTVRVVCANTMRMADNSGTVEYKQSHMNEFDVASAKAAVEEAHENLFLAEKRAKTIDGLKISLEDAVKKVLVPVFEPEFLEDQELMDNILDPDYQPKRFQEIIDSMINAPGAIEGTGWGVLNGVTHWADHVAGNNAGSRLYRSWIGDNSRNKLEVERTLLELAS